MVRKMGMGLVLATALAGALSGGAQAKSANDTMRVGLVIEPSCPINASGEAGAKRVPTPDSARRIAAGVIADQAGANRAQYELEVRHYQRDTGKWEVRQVTPSGAIGPSLLIDKCSGKVSQLG